MELKKIKFYVTEIKAVEDGVIEAKVATQSKDRDGDVLVISGIDLAQYKKNPVVLWSHNYNQPPIGKATKIWKSGTELMARVKFAISESAFASEIYRLYKGGYLNAFSIGFIIKDHDPESSQISKSEMIEFSAVPVPANAEALATIRGLEQVSDKIEKGEMKAEEVKEKDFEIEKTQEEIEKEELNQKIALLEKSVSALQKQVDNNAGVEKIHTVGKIASQSVEAINRQLKGIYGQRNKRNSIR